MQEERKMTERVGLNPKVKYFYEDNIASMDIEVNRRPSKLNGSFEGSRVDSF